ncbi:MAG TPA: HAD-IIB family hydrolase [Candidatus Paceibacterota bacterium]
MITATMHTAAPAVTFDGKQLIIFDLDGTLTPSKEFMRPGMARVLGELLSRVKVAVISGGGFPRFQTQFLRSFPPTQDNLSNLYLLPTSGTRLYTYRREWQEVYREDFTAEEKKRIMDAFKAVLTEVRFVAPEKLYGDLIEDRGSQITFSGVGQNAPISIKEKWDPTREKRLKIVALLRPRLSMCDIRLGGTTSIDVTRRGMNKAYGIHKLEQYLHIPISDMLFVGDALFTGGNDFPAKAAGVDCIQVSGPEETEDLIRSWIASR